VDEATDWTEHHHVNDRSWDEETLRAGLETHHAESWSWALACCRGNVGQAEEALHLTYHKVLDFRARFDGRSSFKTWLFGVIRLTALDQRRWSWRRFSRWAPLSEAENRADPRPGPPDSLARDERCAEMRAALNGLAARQAEVLRLVFYHDLTLDEAAAAMGVSPGTARTHYERGKDRLRRRLAASPLS
jgi:RNA polymerase sigma factor (sigma-70 family)